VSVLDPIPRSQSQLHDVRKALAADGYLVVLPDILTKPECQQALDLIREIRIKLVLDVVIVNIGIDRPLGYLAYRLAFILL
jgi:dienelactone hydrolase